MNLGTPTQWGSISGLVLGGSAPIPKGVGDDAIYFGLLPRDDQRIMQKSQQSSDPEKKEDIHYDA